MERLPVCRDFVVSTGGLVLRDVRSLSRAEARPAYRGFRAYLPEVSAQRDVKICDADTSDYRRKMELAWKRARRKNVDITMEEFLASKPVERDDSEQDETLPELNLAVAEDGRIDGVFGLYNIHVTARTNRVVRCSAMVSPYFRTRRGVSDPAELADIMDALLVRRLECVDGSQIRILRWRFPVSLASHAWLTRPGETGPAGATITQLAEKHEVLYRTVDGEPRPLAVRLRVR